MSHTARMRAAIGPSTAVVLALLLGGCSKAPSDVSGANTAVHLKTPVSALAEPTIRRTVYVPIYSSIYLGLDVRRKVVDLSATLSIRNVSARHPIVVNFVRYYDSAGKQVRDYVTAPAELGPLATAEFVIPRADTAGGPGANFLVQWRGQSDVDEPLIEAVMIGQSGNAGISFTSQGRVIKNEPAE
jgi:hypothetical protein